MPALSLPISRIPPKCYAHPTPGPPRAESRISFSFPSNENLLEFRIFWAAQGDGTMHDFLIALAFIAILIAPAVMTAHAGSDADEAD